MKAGFIGTGSIGEPLATNILDQENSLAVFDINIDATKSLAKKKARVLSSPREIADQVEVIFACMPSIESFRTIVSGPDGVLMGGAMKTFVNLGIMGTEATISVEADLAAKGITMVTVVKHADIPPRPQVCQEFQQCPRPLRKLKTI